MSLSLRPEHLKRYRDIARLLIKYGRSDIIMQTGLDGVLAGERLPVKVSSRVEELPQDLEKLGPTFVKLGQFLSTRADMLPPEYIEALSRLQDMAEQFPYEKVEEIVTSELGMRIPRMFSYFGRTPIAAASLAQVHRATLLDGRQVAVKVQRPDIRRQVVKDLDVLLDIAAFLDRHSLTAKRFMLTATLDEFRKALLCELDFRQEAQNLVLLGKNLAAYRRIVVPAPIDEYTTSKVLTMDFIAGRKVTMIDPTLREEIHASELAEELFLAYLQQILVDGFFHADPHPGNVFLTDDGRIALIDLGMVASISEGLQDKLLRLIAAISDGRAEDAVRYAMELGEKNEDFDERLFSRRMNEMITRHRKATIRDIAVGRVILEVLRGAGESGFCLPSELAMLGKTLLNLDNIGRTLDPEFVPNAALRRHSGELLRQKIRKGLSPASFYGMVMDSKELLEHFPQRVNKIMEALANDEFVLNVNTIDEKYLMTGFQKVANRFALGIILAALIIAAAMMMSVPTRFTLFGYPGLAVILLLLAGGGGVFLAITVLRDDERRRKKPKGPTG